MSATISPKTITITNNTVSPTYDGVTTYAGLISPNAFTLSTPLVGLDNISGVTQAFTVSSSPVSGSGVAQAGTFVATPSNAILSIGTAGNYSFSYTASTNTVAKANLAITETPSTSGNTYNGNAYTGTYTTTFLGNDASHVTITGVATGTDAATYTSNLAVTGSPLNNYNTPVITNANLVIDPKPITISGITANGKTYDGTNSATLNIPTTASLGFVDRDHVIINTTGTSDNVNAGTQSVSLVQSYSGTTSNYIITDQKAKPTAVISARPITVTADNQTKVYGDNNPTLTYTVASDAGSGSSTSRGLASGDSLSTIFTGGLTTTATPSTSVSNVSITQGTLSANSNYSIAVFNNGTLSITARPITVTADNQTKVYGDNNPTLTYKITNGNLVNSDTLSGSITTSADQKTSVTLSPVSITQGTLAASSNYNLTFINGALSITQRPITVTADNQTKVYGDNNPTLTYTVASDAGSGSSTSRGLVNGDSLSGSLTTAATPSTGVSNVNITQGSLTGNPNYVIKTFNDGTLTITARPITISANDSSTTYGTSLTLGRSAYSVTSGSLATVNSDAISSVTLQYDSSATVPATVNAGTYNSSIIASAAVGSGGFNSTNYNITYAAGKLTVNKANLTITANDQSTTYGTALTLGTTAISSSGLVNSDTVTSATLLYNSSATVAGTTAAGTYSIVPSSASGTGLSNYNISYTNGSLVIAKANLTATGTQVYNGTTTFTPSNLTITGVNGQTFTATGTATLGNSGNVQTNQPLSAISLTLTGVSGASTSNYNTLTTAQTSVSVTPKTVSLSANKTYDGSPDLTGYVTVVTGIAGETLNYTGATANSKDVITATYINAIKLTNGTGLASNYQLPSIIGANSSNSVAISTKAVTVSGITASDKVYDGSTIAIINTSGSVAGLIVGDVISVRTTGVFSDANVGINKTVNLTTTITGSDSTNYNFTIQPTTTATITPAPLQVIAGNSAKFTNQTADPVGYNGAIYVGLVGADTSSVLTGTLKLTRSDPTNNAAGTYTLTPSGFGTINGNYAISYQNGTFTIVPQNTLLVSVTNQTINYSSNPNYTSLTAQYLTSDNTIVTLPNVSVSGNIVSVSDNSGNGANFNITPDKVTYSSSRNFNVGGYNLSAISPVITGSLFSSMVITGTLQINTKVIDPNSLITNVAKVYDGNTSITQANATITINPTAIATGDKLSVNGSGYFTDNTNVGTSKPISLNINLSGTDSKDYALSATSITSSVGTITQLASVTYTGTIGGNWSNPLNWTGLNQTSTGAIPTLSNVAQVIIPAATSVVYDSVHLTSLVPTSTIVDNGNLTISAPNNLVFNNIVSGNGSLSLTGPGPVTLTANNSYTGGTNINSATLIIANANAIGTGAVTSSSGTLEVEFEIVLPSLTVNGPVTLASDINTTGAQIYNGAVILDTGYAVSGTVTPMIISTVNGDITFGSTLAAGNNALSTMQSLTIRAGGTGKVTFDGAVGSLLTTNSDTYANYKLNPEAASLYNLDVTGTEILINANITTFSSQAYRGPVLIGDNGTNGPTRIILSEYTASPTVTFYSTIDDSVEYQHNLIVKAVSIPGTNGSDVIFDGAIGSKTPLKSLLVAIGAQDLGTGSKYGDITKYLDGITLKGNVTTYGEQDYYVDSAAGITVVPGTTFTSLNGDGINFNYNAVPKGGGAPPKGIIIDNKAPIIQSATYEVTDLERFFDKVSTETSGTLENNVVNSDTAGRGSIDVIFCGQDENGNVDLRCRVNKINEI